MSRLIDADKAYKELIEIIDWIRDQDYEAYSAVGDDIRIVLDDQPTAFDVGKVVDQLEEVKKIMASPVTEDCFGEECRASDCTICLISKAIEIVKGGGVK